MRGNPSYLTNPSLFISEKSAPHLFGKISKTQTLPYKGRSSNYVIVLSNFKKRLTSRTAVIRELKSDKSFKAFLEGKMAKDKPTVLLPIKNPLF